MKRLLFTFAVCSLIVNMANSQTQFTWSRRDTLTSSTSWHKFYLPNIGRDFSYGIIPKTQTADIRIVFGYSDTTAPKTLVPADLALGNAGTGYLEGELLRVVPQTGTDTLKVTVGDTVGSGVIGSYTITSRGSGYTVGTKNLVGGSGSAATIVISRVANNPASGFYVPFISGVTPSWNVTQVKRSVDTIFVKSDSATVIYHGKW